MSGATCAGEPTAADERCQSARRTAARPIRWAGRRRRSRPPRRRRRARSASTPSASAISRPIERDALARLAAPRLRGNDGATCTGRPRSGASRRASRPGATRAVVVLEALLRAGAGRRTGAARASRATRGARTTTASSASAWPRWRRRWSGSARRRAATRCYVDAGPVPERELAQRAGLGWIAKNTMLIHPRLGSFTFIGSGAHRPRAGGRRALRQPTTAGSCRACLDACPTDAFPAARVLDARRCISYLTIEHRGPFAAGEGRLIGDWLFGCDVCQDVCPWNEKFAAPTDEPRFAPRAGAGRRPTSRSCCHLDAGRRSTAATPTPPSNDPAQRASHAMLGRCSRTGRIGP